MTAPTQHRTVATVAPAQPQHDTVPSGAVTREELCQSIVDKTGCTPHKAQRLVNLVGDWLGRARQHPAGVCFPYFEEMDTEEYHLFDAVVPHGAVATPGSVHAKMEGYFLKGNELAIMHDRVRDSDTTPEHCEVALKFSVQR